MPAYVLGINNTEVGALAGYRWPIAIEDATAWLERMREKSRGGEGFYEKVGFQREGVMRRSFRVNGTLTDTVMMAILSEEWEAQLGAGG
jgi:hypothetical protein